MIKAEITTTIYTAITLSVREVKTQRERGRVARKIVRDIAFRGCTRSMIEWLFIKQIPFRCKLRELAIAPWKLWRFLSGRADEAAILQWRSTR